MKTLSKTEYQNDLTLKSLIKLKLPSIYFAKAAISMGRSVQHLIVEKDKKECLDALETAEKYLSGEATLEVCHEAADAAHKIYMRTYVRDHYAAYAAYTAYAAIRAAYATTSTALCCITLAAGDAKSAAYHAALALRRPSPSSDVFDILKHVIPWNLVCAFQIAKCFGREEDEQSIRNIVQDENLIHFATTLLEHEKLREKFEFFIKNYPKI